jgi:hypothetical protein
VPNVPLAKKSFWSHKLELLGDVGNVESGFRPFGDNTNFDASICIVCAKHTIGSEIILDAPDGSPR